MSYSNILTQVGALISLKLHVDTKKRKTEAYSVIKKCGIPVEVHTNKITVVVVVGTSFLQATIIVELRQTSTVVCI